MSTFFGAHNIISPLGYNSHGNFESLLQGRSAIQSHSFSFSEKPLMCAKLDEAMLNMAFAAYGNPKDFTKLEKMCLLSIKDVVQQSGVDLWDKQNLLILSTTKGNIDVLENVYPSLPQERVYLHSFAKTIGEFFRCANTPLVVSNACISGLLAIIIARRFLEAGSYKNILICGADLVSEFTLSGFKSFNAMSDAPCKPFDAQRKGINLGEAAATVLLSKERVGNIAILAGASANDANHISGPSRNGDGLYQAVQQVCTTTGRSSFDLISAHGTATEYNDDMESMAFDRAALNHIPLHSLKGYYGHTLGAAGILESIVSICSLQENSLLRSQGFDTEGTVRPLNVIRATTQQKLNSCLKTASGFGGCNAAAIFEKQG